MTVETDKHIRIKRLRRYTVIAMVSWTLVLGFSYWTQINGEEAESIAIASAEARIAYQKDLLYRRWSARHGGVYVPVTADTPPNPNLSHVPERDIVTPSGRTLTLINPAYMTRQVFQFAKDFTGPQGHIVSLKPLYPGNAPDDWEAEGLRSFERGVPEVTTVQQFGSKPVLRYMRPLIAEAPCLKCHAAHGYRQGGIRGGISVSIPMGELLAASRRETRLIGLWHGVIWGMGIFFIGAGGRQLNRDTRLLLEQDYRLQEQNEELVTTEEELRHQIEESQRTQEELLAVKNQLETVILCMGDGLTIIGTDFRILYQNRVTKELFGDGVGRPCYEVYRCGTSICPDCPVESAFADGQVHRLEFQVAGPQGSIWLENIASPLYDGAGHVVGGVEVMRNVTERKLAQEQIERLNETLEQRVAARTAALAEMNRNLESEVRQRIEIQEEVVRLNERLMGRTKALESANRELETFSYTVSHDLRAPLRHINGFCQVLLEEYLDQLDSNCQDYLQRVCFASKRMGNLIDDLLQLSRVTRTEMRREKVNISEMCLAVADSLQDNAPQRQVQFVIAQGAVVDGDEGLLRQLVENLLGNAWKYTAKQPAAFIEFGMEKAGEETVYFVRDNGAGFDMKFASKLFKPFQRLHGQEFEGNGIGLATVQRIVHRHGGRIWGEGVVAHGATFHFTIPPPDVIAPHPHRLASYVDIRYLS